MALISIYIYIYIHIYIYIYTHTYTYIYTHTYTYTYTYIYIYIPIYMALCGFTYGFIHGFTYGFIYEFFGGFILGIHHQLRCSSPEKDPLEGWTAGSWSGFGHPTYFSEVKKWLPSGELTFCNGKSPFYSWENPLFLWPFSIAMLVHQRVEHLEVF